MSTQSIGEERGRKGYVNLLGIYEFRSQKHVGDDKKGTTLLDKGLALANELYTTSVCLLDTHLILELCCTFLVDGSATFSQKRQMTYSLSRLLVPLNNAAAKILHEAAKNVAPIRGCHDYHKRCETEQKRNAEVQLKLHTEMGLTTSVPIQRITEYLRSPSASVNVDVPRPKRHQTSVT